MCIIDGPRNIGLATSLYLTFSSLRFLTVPDV